MRLFRQIRRVDLLTSETVIHLDQLTARLERAVTQLEQTAKILENAP